jgi:hypothetical protein
MDEVLWVPRRRSGLLAHFASFFVAPADEAAPPPVAAKGEAAADSMPHACMRAAVLGRRGDVPVAAAAAAGELRCAAGARAAAVLLWEPDASAERAGEAPAAPAARALARSLADGAVSAEARGFVARVRLPSEPIQAAAAAVRIADRLDGIPAVLALAGPRATAFDALLAEQAIIGLLAAPHDDEVLLALAERSLEGLDAAVIRMPAPAGAARALAAAGLGRAPALRAIREAP